MIGAPWGACGASRRHTGRMNWVGIALTIRSAPFRHAASSAVTSTASGRTKSGRRFDRRVVASYPEYDDQILVSGYLKGADLLERRAAVVDLRVGKGRVVLIGVRAQHRAQPHRTFKLLFNSLYLAGLKEIVLD